MSVDGRPVPREAARHLAVRTHAQPARRFEVQAIQQMITDPKSVAKPHPPKGGRPADALCMRVEAALRACVDCHEMEGPASPRSSGEPRFAKDAPIGALLVEVPLGPASRPRASDCREGRRRAVILIVAPRSSRHPCSRRRQSARSPGCSPPSAARGRRLPAPVKVEASGRVSADRMTRSRAIRAQVSRVLRVSGTVSAVHGRQRSSPRAATIASGNRGNRPRRFRETTLLAARRDDGHRASQRRAFHREAKRIASDRAHQARSAARPCRPWWSRDVRHHGGRRIYNISTTIDEIAFQTNLLALNAAGRSRRAATQGRSFMVVANEVGAARCADAMSKEIKTVISDRDARGRGGTRSSAAPARRSPASSARWKRVASNSVGRHRRRLRANRPTASSRVSRAVQQMDQVTQETASRTEEVDEHGAVASGRADGAPQPDQPLQAGR